MSPENQIRLELLRSAPLNSWIALSEDESRIVAVGADFAEVSQKADDAGEPDALLLKTPPTWSRTNGAPYSSSADCASLYQPGATPQE